MRLRHAALACAALSLGLVLAFQAGLGPRRSGQPSPPDLESLLPRTIPGWKSQDLPLGPTESEDTDVRRTLDFDACCYREYASAGRRLAVYAAYWGGRRYSPTIVGVHIPEICWTADGWTCERAQAFWRLPASVPALWPAHYRWFRADGRTPQHVIFWHLLGGKPFYGDPFIDGSRNLGEYARANLLHLAGRGPEQLFVRLNSDRSFEELADDPGFRLLVAALARLGLAPSEVPH